ncbi:hypothetical protein Tco_1484953 [Tanacetum coccineum]
MADHLRPMEELLQIAIIGMEDAIVVPAVLANEFELKIELLDFISNNPFFGHENNDPHSHIKRFYQITQTFKINQVSHDVVKLILFPFSLKGAAETWLENEPPCSITSWDDLVSKFLNRFILILKQESSEKKSRTFNKFSMRLLQKLGKDSKSTPLIPPPKTPPLSAPKPKEDPKPNPYQPSIPYPSRLQEENFQALENLTGNPTPSSDLVVESLSPSPIPCEDSDSLMEETDTLLSHFNDSSPDYETFFFDIEETSSGSTTSISDLSLPDYEVFCFEEKSSGRLLILIFLFLNMIRLSLIDPFPPADRSDFYHEEFVDELAHIISPPEYDYFYFDPEADQGEFTSDLEKNIFDLSTKDFTKIPSGESKVHIEVLSVLWENRLPGLVGQDARCLGS